jgi:hypothetical protein
MAGKYFDRYSKFRIDNSIEMVPFIDIRKKDTDIFTEYVKGQSRLDNISFEYYGDPNYGWLILQANAEYGSMEYNIPDRSILRIPFPLDLTLAEYKQDIDTYKKYYK